MRSTHRSSGATIVAILSLLTACARYQLAAPLTPMPVVTDSSRLTVTAAAGAPVALRTPRERVVDGADELLGTRYRYGGVTPEDGFDCSGFVQFLFAREGIDLPRTARAMSRSGTRVPARRPMLLPGDLLFFAESGGRVSHVALYVGDGRIIHASSGRGAVRYDDLDSARGQWFRRHIVSARRYIGEASQTSGIGEQGEVERR